MNALVRYDAARRALAEARCIDEVADIRNKALAMEVYAKQAKDGELIAWSTEIKMRAERRLGEVMEDERQAGLLAKAAGSKGKRGFLKNPRTLAKRGIDKNLADRARKAAAMPEGKFEAGVDKVSRVAAALVEGDAAVIKASRLRLREERIKKRYAIETAVAAKIKALPGKKYGVILADPEWKFKTWDGLSTGAEHYATSELDAIKKRDVPSISAKDCVLFLWATVPMVTHALEVMEAWGFKYVSQVAWVKGIAGTGYWFINKHEMLLVGTKGNVPAPAPGTQILSVIEAPRGKHSEKPEVFLEMVEKYFPTLPKIELNRRGPARDGWDAWGAEATP
jgi:N6-adenosine-specific RNA methylase IME4